MFIHLTQQQSRSETLNILSIGMVYLIMLVFLHFLSLLPVVDGKMFTELKTRNSSLKPTTKQVSLL